MNSMDVINNKSLSEIQAMLTRRCIECKNAGANVDFCSSGFCLILAVVVFSRFL